MARRVAYAVTRGDEPRVLIAEDDAVLSRLLALRLVAATPARAIDPETADVIRRALLEERWADALVEWMGVTDTVVDAFPDEPVWSEADLDAERASLEIRLAPIFRDD